MTKLAQAIKEVETGIEDALADFPELDESEVVSEIVRSVCCQYDVETSQQLQRRFGLRF